MHAIRACFGLNRDRTPERVRQPERRRTDPPQPPQRQGVPRHVAGVLPDPRTNPAFDRMNTEQKIEWLLQASPVLNQEHTFPSGKIQAGTRSMSDREALCFALEMAIEFHRNFVPVICERLLQAYPADTVRFNVFGIDFDRNRLQEWTRAESVPSPRNELSSAIASVEATMTGSNHQGSGYDRAQNVHNDRVMIAMTGQLLCIRQRVLPEKSVRMDEAERQIANLVRTIPSAPAGLNDVLQRNDVVTNFDMSPRACLTLVWNYINSLPDARLQQQLKDSMAAKLEEIHLERPCAVGMIERIIDIPTGIDLSLSSGISLASLREELQRIAARVNEEFEGEMTDYLDLLRMEVGQPHMSQDPDELLTEWKRDRFLQIARVEFELLQGIDPMLIRSEVERIFPQGVML